jgi:hypothetical protein
VPIARRAGSRRPHKHRLRFDPSRRRGSEQRRTSLEACGPGSRFGLCPLTQGEPEHGSGGVTSGDPTIAAQSSPGNRVGPVLGPAETDPTRGVKESQEGSASRNAGTNGNFGQSSPTALRVTFGLVRAFALVDLGDRLTVDVSSRPSVMRSLARCRAVERVSHCSHAQNKATWTRGGSAASLEAVACLSPQPLPLTLRLGEPEESPVRRALRPPPTKPFPKRRFLGR